MIRVWIVFILLAAGIVWAIIFFIKKRKAGNSIPPSTRFASTVKANEVWAQLYETNSLEDLNALRMRLSEEKLNFIAFEQGKRDSQGNIPKAFGVAVSKAHLSRAQTILARILS